MDLPEFREALLGLMERKSHWAWPAFSRGLVPRDTLHIHLEQEYAVFVRDFPVLVARGYVQCPVASVRRELIANVYEEETGGLSAGRPHPDLFLLYPEGLGMDLSRFERVQLLPCAAAFRAFLDHATLHRGWAAATAVTTLFIEGTSYERGEIDPNAPRRPVSALDDHPLVKHYGLPLEHLALTKVHRSVEGDHRRAAWAVVDHMDPADYAVVLETMGEALSGWLGYRDEVAHACGLRQSPSGEPTLRA